MYRQGDLLFRKTNLHPLYELKPVGNEYVVAEGEATGHAHRLSSEGGIAIAGVTGAVRALSLPEAGVLTHEEHGSVELPAGDYTVTQEREHNYAAESADAAAEIYSTD